MTAFEPSTIVMVAVCPLTAAPPVPAEAVPLMVTPAAASVLLMMLSPATGDVIAIVGTAVASVKTTGALEPTLPAASVSWATMLWLPLPGSVTVVDQAPPTTVAVPICVVTPLTVSNNVTVDPAAASAAATVPEIICEAWLVVVPVVLIRTVGARVSTAIAWLVVVAALPAASETFALML